MDCLDQQFDIRDFGDSETEQSEGSQPLVLIGHANEFFVDDSMHLAVQIAGKRVARSGERRSYILKEGIFGAFGRVLIDDEVSFKPAPLQAGYSSHSILPSDFYGPSGDDLDVIGKGLDLPDMEEGDWIVFKDHGHYSMCPRTQENFFAIQVPGGRFNCDLW